MKVILASGSPRRQELLKKIFPEFDIIVSNVDEVLPKGLESWQGPEYLASMKAKKVAQEHREDLVIGCDTGVFLNQEVFGKPKDWSEANEMLHALSGKCHYVITGVCLAYNGRITTFSEKTAVWMYPLSNSEINSYLHLGEYKDKAGAYGIQDRGALLIQGIQGDYYNVVGLPIARLAREITAFLNSENEE